MDLFKSYPISKISYVKVGGTVNKLYVVKNEEDFKLVLTFEKNVRIIGQSSKILFAFNYDSSTYILDRNDYIFETNDYIEIGGGTHLNKIGAYFEKNGYDGFSKIRTIPGRLGGSIVQNASCYNQSISDNIIEVKVIYNNKIMYKSKQDLAFSYRSSIFKFVPYVILSARYKKIKKDLNLLIKETNETILLRNKTQPVDKLTFGSTFKNFNGYVVSKILDELSLKGFSCSDKVCISKKHSNFLEIKKDCSYEQIILLLHSLSGVLYKWMGVFFPLEIVVFKEDYFGN